MVKAVNFDNILNVRDFGGQSVSGGRRVEVGRLFRGAQLSSMSESDRKRLLKWKISLIVDMRYRSERKRQATDLDRRFKTDIFELLEEHDLACDAEMAPHELFVLNELETSDDARRYMMNSYTERPLSSAFISITARSLKRMAQDMDNLYIHCAVGKDRTGTFAAVLLALLGASSDDIMEDYMRTNQEINLELIMEMTLKKMEDRYGRPFLAGSLHPFFGVEPAFLEQSLKGIGDVQVYAKTVLGLTEQELIQLRAHYLD